MMRGFAALRGRSQLLVRASWRRYCRTFRTRTSLYRFMACAGRQLRILGVI
ncbi:hypothetical protein DOTSEDRAFT_52925 [Dothistroma septosporum NZE10]|uniref:Uncharacterized protein n=1 Tax=Dothistroma septosporum (strain NZE10 / CBS 128990) TaxID=675120 RepID=N1PTI8_DOTSN|nr:hypothetical protein DOTSEDRAFT_52925 [Dothistroma septosporum NZE10]